MPPAHEGLPAMIEQHRSMLLRMARSLIRSRYLQHLDPSDVVQNTMLDAHLSSHKLETFEPNSVVRWLKKALVHNVLDSIKHLTTQKKDVRRTVRSSREEGGPLDILAAQPCLDTSPSQSLAKREELELLLLALSHLPENQRLALSMKHLEGLSLQQIAASLGVSEAATAGLLHRGRKALHRIIESSVV